MTLPEEPAHKQRTALVFDGRYIQDRYHGIGRYAFHLLRELAVLLPQQRFVVLRDPALPDSRFDWAALQAVPNIRVQPLTAPPFGVAEQVVLPRTVARQRRPLYHTPYFALPWVLPAPAIVTVHDCIFEHDPRYMPRRWARAYYRLLMSVSLARAQAVLVPSRATVADVRRFYRVPTRKLRVTPEAADAAFQPIEDAARRAEVRTRYGLPERFVLAVGARRPHKNFARLVQAIAGLDGLPLVFVGGADARFPDETAAAARGLGDRVRFLGAVPEADLPVLYNLATVLASPSIIEGFGLPVLEAMACGTPVVCSAIPVFEEVAGAAAILVAPDDTAAWTAALCRVAGDPALQAQLRAGGLARAAGFSWRRAAGAVLPVYARLGINRPTGD
jgi:glycosyltransferase involved in cell wall biosynthesis